MKPTNDPDDAVVDLLDVVMEEGVVVEADVLITVADVPLLGLKLRAALAGMTTMTEYGMLTGFDESIRTPDESSDKVHGAPDESVSDNA